jgi:hypothetical protein
MKLGEMAGEYRFTTEVNHDTELLAEVLQAEYWAVMKSDLMSGPDSVSAMTCAW